MNFFFALTHPSGGVWSTITIDVDVLSNYLPEPFLGLSAEQPIYKQWQFGKCVDSKVKADLTPTAPSRCWISIFFPLKVRITSVGIKM